MNFRWLRSLFRRHKPVASFGRTDTGRVRANNEDSFAIISDLNMFLVADGMGGHNAGEVASRVAIETLIDYFSVSALRSMRGKREQIHHYMINGLCRANEEVMRMAAADVSKQGMGCTIVVALIDGRTLHVCHVGDARCYYGDVGDLLVQITTDHTLRARTEIVDPSTGLKRQVNRHVVTRAIGFPFREDPEYHVVELSVGAKVLLCSDGLWSMIDDFRLGDIMHEANSPEEAADIMIREANEAGGRDNITAVVVYS